MPCDMCHARAQSGKFPRSHACSPSTTMSSHCWPIVVVVVQLACDVQVYVCDSWALHSGDHSAK